jgi:hypothetical protein
MKELGVYQDLYLVNIFFIKARSVKKVKKKFNVDWNGLGGTTQYKANFFILINPKHKEYDIAVIVHECGHVTALISEYLELNFNMKEDEAYQYLNSWIFRQALLFYEKDKRHCKIYKKLL